MKKLSTPALALCLIFLTTIPASAGRHRYKGRVMQCISGNCVNGSGVAIVSMNSDYEGDERNQLHYTGTFKDGLMDGEGTAYKVASSSYVEGEKKSIYIGRYSEGEQDGYCTEFKAKYRGLDPVPDSSEPVNFLLYERSVMKKELNVGIDGVQKAYRFGNHSVDEIPLEKLGDDWLTNHAAAYVASRGNHFAAIGTPTATPVVIARKSFAVARNTAITFVQWACLTDRKYFVTASSRMKNGQMPFGGHVAYQVLDAGGSIVFQANADTYWAPAKAGPYTFLVRYTQEFEGNGVDLRVEALPLECTLQSRSL